MAEENPSTPATEAEPQQTTQASSDTPDVESMLSHLEGFDQYFGSEQKSETGEKSSQDSSSGDEGSVSAETSEVSSEPEKAEGDATGGEEEDSPVQKRIDKLTAQKHEALERAEKAEAKLKEWEARAQALPVLTPTKENPLTAVQSLPELEQKLIDARQVKRWALENLEGGQVQQGDGVRDLEAQEVRQLLATAEDLITIHIPQRLKYLENRAVNDAEVRKHYPNFFKENTEEFQVLKKWVHLVPEVLNFPDFRLIIADALAGQRQRLAKNNAKNGAPSKTTPLAAPQPSSAPRTTQKSVLSKELLARMATDRRALDIFSESLIGTGGSK